MRLRGLAVAVLLFGEGCQYGAYFLRDATEPVRALEVRMDAGGRRRDCLVVFMPGILDTPDTFVRQGFLAEAARASDRCDLVAVDAHFGYYAAGSVRERVGQDVIRVAEARGYRDVWLVGVSMGGLGALLVARDHPDIVRGVVLLAPYLAEETLGNMGAAGKSGRAPPSGAPDESIWAWLRGCATHPERMPAIYVGVGTEDWLRPDVTRLAALLPEGHHGTVPGGHGWSTWTLLWHRLMETPPWAPDPGALARGEAPRF